MEPLNLDKRAQRKSNNINYKDFNRMGIKDPSSADTTKNTLNGAPGLPSSKLQEGE